MNGLSVVIPSRNGENLFKCINAIYSKNSSTLHGSRAVPRTIAIDDGLRDGAWYATLTIPGAKPFIFARNVNLGIAAAGSDDVIVLNDDAILETSEGFSALHWIAEQHPEYGLISASCNNVGNTNMWRKNSGGLRWEPRMVCFTCVLIPRRTIDAVGLLDERFIDYGLEDDDYCLRVRTAGLKIGIYDGCFVDHSKLKSTFRSAAAGNNAPGDFRPNMRRFIEKWGVDNWGRGRAESDFADLFPSEVGR